MYSFDRKILENIIKKYGKDKILSIYKLYFMLNENLLLNIKEKHFEKYMNILIDFNPEDLENLIYLFDKYDIDETKEFEIFKKIKMKYISYTTIKNFNPLKKGYN